MADLNLCTTAQRQALRRICIRRFIPFSSAKLKRGLRVSVGSLLEGVYEFLIPCQVTLISYFIYLFHTVYIHFIFIITKVTLANAESVELIHFTALITIKKAKRKLLDVDFYSERLSVGTPYFKIIFIVN